MHIIVLCSSVRSKGYGIHSIT